MEKIDTALANVLRKLREKKDISQEELSFRAELHRTYISQLERGLKSVTVKTLVRITDVLEIDIDDFMKMVKNELKKL
ncbi:MAG: helix-turn-helix transcriptional regulator [Bacteroidota bacterium]